MLSRATGLFSIYRGTTTNASGDTVDDNINPLAVDVQLALRNSARLFEPPSTDSPRTVSTFYGRAGKEVDLQSNDRIQDQETLILYVVRWVSAPLSSTRISDLMFEAHRVS